MNDDIKKLIDVIAEMETNLFQAKTVNETLRKQLLADEKMIIVEQTMDIIAAQGIPKVMVTPENKSMEELEAEMKALPYNQRYAYFVKHNIELGQEVLPSSKEMREKQLDYFRKQGNR